MLIDPFILILKSEIMKKYSLTILFFALLQLSAFSQTFTINASSGTDGTITPSGAVVVNQNTDQIFTITANTGFQISMVTVDGKPVGAVSSYTFPAVSAAHIISVTYSVVSRALNKPAFAENSEPGSSPANANNADGSILNFWSGTAYPKWWKVDLQGFFDLTSIIIRNYVDGSRYYNYNIEASDDDITYTLIASKTNTNLSTFEGDMYPVTNRARYLRVNMTFNSTNPGTQICDFRVYGAPSANTHIINATAGTGGVISPTGDEMVLTGTTKTFTISPNSGFAIDDVVVDGTSVGKVSTYSFTPITSNHTIAATFVSTTRVLTVTQTTGGTITPAGTLGSVIVNLNADQVFNIAAKSGFQISDVKVNGASVGPLSTYTFTNITTNGTITATYVITSHLALNKPASAQTTDGSYGPSYANDSDGSNNLFWSAPTYPSWWKVDLQNICNLTSIVIRNYFDGVRAYHYNIEISSDDVTYTKIAEKTNDNPSTDDGDMYNVSSTGRYIRVNMIFNSTNSGTHITDFRVYGSKTLTISGVTVSSKEYDGNTNAVLIKSSATLVGIASGDNVTLVSTGATGTFANKNVGPGKAVTISGFTLSGTDANKYSLTQPSATADITAKVLTIGGSFAISGKVYDGTSLANISANSLTLITKIGTDVVSLNPVAVFASKVIGTGLTVSLTGSSLTGSDGANYTLSLAGAPTAIANITSKVLTIGGTFTVSNKNYDGTASAVILLNSLTIPDKVTGDNVNINAVAVFNDMSIGTSKPVSLTGSSISGSDASNYTLSLTGAPLTTANISFSGLTVTGITANNKVYDGTTTAVLNTSGASLVGVLGSDVVTLVKTSATGNFADKNRGSGKIVTISGINLSGPDAGKYSLTQPVSTANITSAQLTITGIVANNKVYDETTSVGLNTASAILVGVFGGDNVTLISSGATGTVTDKNTGNDKPVSISGVTLGGTDAGNYTLTQPISTASITPVVLTISGVTASNKVYDGTTAAVINTVSASLSGVLTGDVVFIASSATEGTFADKNAGTGKSVSTSGFTISGTGVVNYTLTQPTLIADISAKELTLSANDLSKSYGKLLAFTGTEYSVSALVSGDVLSGLTISSPGSASSAVVGSYVISVTGGVNNNYHFTYVTGTLTVNKSTITVTADTKTKAYGSENPVLSISYSGFGNSEDASVLNVVPVTETNANKTSDAGDYEINVSGAVSSNYNFIYNKGVLRIEKADQTIIFDALPAGLRITQEYQLIAVAASGLSVSFDITDPEIAKVNGNALVINKDGNFTITASQAGDHNWNAATDVTQSVVTLPTFDNAKSLFTPNNDGVNDYWYIPDLEQYGKLQVTVYNRYGQAVYQSDSYKNDWDGTWNGYALPVGTYYYLIKSSEKGFTKGVVNIIR